MGVALIARRTIRASVERVFEAWTQPELLRAWWGPRPVTCSGADVDLRVGGKYRIVNALPDGSSVTSHEKGWEGCLDGLERLFNPGRVSAEPRARPR
jgi:uncharacterized protein YndB with AHSA1/START domain